jgi:hypothetical protein
MCARLPASAWNSWLDDRTRRAQRHRGRHKCDSDIIAAVKALGQMRGGQVAILDGQVEASLPLPIAGLVSDQPLEDVIEKISNLNAAAARLAPF